MTKKVVPPPIKRKYRVTLDRTTVDSCQVTVWAYSPSQAGDFAIDNHIGQHKWGDQETLDIRVTELTPISEEI